MYHHQGSFFKFLYYVIKCVYCRHPTAKSTTFCMLRFKLSWPVYSLTTGMVVDLVWEGSQSKYTPCLFPKFPIKPKKDPFSPSNSQIPIFSLGKVRMVCFAKITIYHYLKKNIYGLPLFAKYLAIYYFFETWFFETWFCVNSSYIKKFQNFFMVLKFQEKLDFHKIKFQKSNRLLNIFTKSEITKYFF